MFQNFNQPFLRTVSAVALALAFAASTPALAYQGQGMGMGMGMGPGMGHPNCYCPNAGMAHPQALRSGPMREDCPYAQAQVRKAKAPGKSLGVMVQDLPDAALDEKGMSYGIRVARVQIDSAAAAAGLKSGDIIQEFNGKPIYSGDRLRWLVRQSEVGKALEIKVLRDGAPMTLNATLADPVAKPKCDEPAAPRVGT